MKWWNWHKKPQFQKCHPLNLRVVNAQSVSLSAICHPTCDDDHIQFDIKSRASSMWIHTSNACTRSCGGQHPNRTLCDADAHFNAFPFDSKRFSVWWKEVLGSCCALFPLWHRVNGECLEMRNHVFAPVNGFIQNVRFEFLISYFFFVAVAKREHWAHIDDDADDGKTYYYWLHAVLLVWKIENENVSSINVIIIVVCYMTAWQKPPFRRKLAVHDQDFTIISVLFVHQASSRYVVPRELVRNVRCRNNIIFNYDFEWQDKEIGFSAEN